MTDASGYESRYWCNSIPEEERDCLERRYPAFLEILHREYFFACSKNGSMPALAPGAMKIRCISIFQAIIAQGVVKSKAI
jgi:hypothetical protein